MPLQSDPASEVDADTPRRKLARRSPILGLFFGRGTAVAREPLRILRLVGLGILFENYDIGLVNAALPQIAEDLHIAMGEAGFYLGAVRLGGIGTLLLLPFADRVGRRRVFLLALIGMSVGTVATAFSQTPLQFTLLQFTTRAFMLTASALSVVILVEEFPAGQRGGALGLLALLGGLGYGLGAGLYALVESLPYGWRSLYGAGVIPLFLLPSFRRSLRETRRFEEHIARSSGAAGRTGMIWTQPFFELFRRHPRRAVAISLAGLFGSMGSIAVFQYTSAFVQGAHGWSPGLYSLLVLGGGLIGMCGNLVGGRGSDRFGRRTIGFLCLCAAPFFAVAFFNGPAATLVVCWGFYVLCMAASDVVVRAFSAELFPTSHRGASGGVLIAIQAVGFSAGLFAVGLGTDSDSFVDLGRTVALVSLASIIAAFALLLLPETHDRELEAISEDI